MRAAAVELALRGVRIPERLEIFSVGELALEVALQEAARRVREEAANYSERIRTYWLSLDPPLDIRSVIPRPPWCAVFVQFCWDVSAELLHTRNPLNDVPLEALVQSYHDLAIARGWIIPAHEATRGDLVFYAWHGQRRYDHIGMVEIGPGYLNTFRTAEGNTPPADDGDQSGKGVTAADGLYRKKRRMTVGSPVFARPK